MAKHIIIVFIVLLIHHNALAFNSILAQISSDKRCEHLFLNFTLSQVSQFGATCDITIPKTDQGEFLLKNNVIPILCMGVYDVSVRLCTAATEDKASFSEIFPPTEDKFTKIFERLENLDAYSSLEKFCSHTVLNYANAVNDSSSYITKVWWDILKTQLTNNKSCMTTCRTNESNRVHPLCSYIIWSDGIYLNYLKNKLESQVAVQGGVQIISDLTNNLTSGKENWESHADVNTSKSSVNVPDGNELVSQLEVSNPTAISALSAPGNSGPQNISHGVVAEPMAAHLGKLEKKTGTEGNISDSNTDPVTNSDKNLTLSKLDPGKSAANILQTTSNKANKEKTGEPVAEQDPNIVTTADEEKKADVNKETLSQNTDEKNENEEEMPDANPYGDAEQKSTTNMSDADNFNSFEVQNPNIGLEDEDEDQEGSEGEEGMPLIKNGVADKPNPGTNLGLKMDQQHEDVRKILPDPFQETEDSNFFPFFLCAAVLTIMAYLVFHNKKKLVALAIEGRKSRGSRRRPNCSKYSKLDCNLEEAMVSNTKASVTQVLY